MRLPLYALAIALASPAFAQAGETDNWTTTSDAVHAGPAGISLPQQAGSLTIVKTGEVSGNGSGADSYAQYISADNVVQATAFIYKPGFADTAIAALGTERALIERFGPATKRVSQTTVAAGGRNGVALRTIYSGAAEGQLVLAAAFIRSGDWIVKLRVTATSDRLADVEAGLDSMLKNIRFDAPANVRAANLVKVDECAASPSAAPASADPSFPRDGADALCRRGVVTVGDASFEMLQPVGRDMAAALLVPTDDAGGLLRFDRTRNGYRLTRYGAGANTSSVHYDRLPDAKQIAAIIGGKDAQPARSTTTALK